MAFIYCYNCGKQVTEKVPVCPYCNTLLQTENKQAQTTQQPYESVNTTHQQVYVTNNEFNASGIVGFVFAILGLFLGWIPYVGWIIWLLGVIFSFIGLFKKPFGFATAGCIISIMDFIILVSVVGSIVAFIGALI